KAGSKQPTDSYIDREILVQGVNAISILQAVSQQTGHYTHLLVGNGGVGKTYFASFYFQYALENSLYDVMLWVDASDLMGFFKARATFTGIKIKDNVRAKNWIEYVYQKFEQAGKLLLVINNIISPTQCVDEITKTIVSDFLWKQSKETSGLRHLIITSRYQRWS
ncbi:MAG: hypothetical protein ACK4PR_14420, partial [Gammaproteobacteria bacterium]